MRPLAHGSSYGLWKAARMGLTFVLLACAYGHGVVPGSLMCMHQRTGRPGTAR
jgi:hypothetical protein